VTPQAIAGAAIETAVAHIHVRDPETGKGGRDVSGDWHSRVMMLNARRRRSPHRRR
jgi:uncharacterized protein (DUF849 family)